MHIPINNFKSFLNGFGKRSVLLLISSLFSLILLEAFARIYLFSPIALIPAYGNSVAYIGISGIIRPSENREIIYELKPYLNTLFKLAKLKTNSQGLSDKEYSIKKPKNTYRIAVIGSSYTMPAGVSIENAYHSILERLYNEENKVLKFEFINFGVGGYMLDQLVAVLKHKVMKYEPDYIMVELTANLWGFPKFKQEFTVLDLDFKPRFKENWYYKWWAFRLIKETLLRENISDEEILAGIDFNKLDFIFSEFKRISTQNKIDIIFVILRRNYEDSLKEKLFDTYIELLSEYKLSFIDTREAFEKHKIDFDETIIYRYDNHPNKLAHRIFAEAIKKELVLK